jgi:hypothetical protein
LIWILWIIRKIKIFITQINTNNNIFYIDTLNYNKNNNIHNTNNTICNINTFNSKKIIFIILIIIFIITILLLIIKNNIYKTNNNIFNNNNNNNDNCYYIFFHFSSLQGLPIQLHGSTIQVLGSAHPLTLGMQPGARVYPRPKAWQTKRQVAEVWGTARRAWPAPRLGLTAKRQVSAGLGACLQPIGSCRRTQYSWVLTQDPIEL